MAESGYDSDGKRAFRSLLLELAKRDGLKTYGTLWGTGIDSRLFAAEGFDVTAAEMVRAKHDAMTADAEAHGYSAFCGNAKRLDQRFDMFHADFCGTASPRNFEVLRAISEKVDRWLAVTLSPDHQLDPSMQGEAAAATVPAWLTFASGLTLEYVARYVRNDIGQTMWCALLRRREGNGNSHRVQPLQVSWSLEQRGKFGRTPYWASAAMYREHRELLRHSQPVTSWDKAEAVKARYAANRDQMRAKSRDYYQRNQEAINANVRERRANDPDWRNKSREYQRRYHAKHPPTPEQLAKRKAYRRQWYLDHREEQIAAAAAWRKRQKVVAP